MQSRKLTSTYGVRPCGGSERRAASLNRWIVFTERSRNWAANPVARHNWRGRLLIQQITRAAKRLFSTPPSISAHIKMLEDEWNAVLFRRTPRGMEITEKPRSIEGRTMTGLRMTQYMLRPSEKPSRR